MTSLAPSSTKSIMLWSSKFSLFEPSIYESGGQYPEEIAEMINALETGSVASVVRPEPHWNMLDVGAGGGRWSISFSGRVGSVTALEPSAIFTILKERTEAFKNIVCHRKAFEEFAASSKFNLIIISGVLMYILEPLELEKILRKAVDLTENGGFLVLREPVARAERCFTDTSYRS
ncbi:MAG: class I SAM-dependent methyltransferase, partial [Syntrophobacteraceae bacterium]